MSNVELKMQIAESNEDRRMKTTCSRDILGSSLGSKFCILHSKFLS